MRICTVLREHPPNFSGGGVHAVELINALHRQGHEVHIVSPLHGDRLYVPNQVSDTPTANNIHDAVILSELPERNIHLVDTTPRSGFGDLLREILRLHHEIRFDVVHIHFVCPLAILAGLIEATNGPPTVVSAHGGDVFLLAGVPPSTLSALAVPPASFTGAVASGLRAAHQVITVSEELRDLCVNRLGVRAERARFMTHGIDFGSFDYRVDGAQVRAERGIAPEDRLVLFTGRLSREKGVSRLIEAVPLLLARQPKAKLLVAGDGPERLALESQAVALGVAHAVRFLGVVPYAVIPQYRAACDVLVLPSLSEGTPVSVYESFAMKRPVVATAVGGMRDAIRNHVNGRVVGGRIPEEIADVVSDLLERPAERHRLAAAAFEDVQGLSWSSVAARVAAVYSEVQKS
jgi:glycosyltransferase involved in cell wall biosynthesis